MAALEPFSDSDYQTIRKEWERIATDLGWDRCDVRIRLDNIQK